MSRSRRVSSTSQAEGLPIATHFSPHLGGLHTGFYPEHVRPARHTAHLAERRRELGEFLSDGLPRYSEGHAHHLPGVGLGSCRRMDAALRFCSRGPCATAIRRGRHPLRSVLRPELECRHDDCGLRRVGHRAERPVDDDRPASLPPAHLRVPRVSLHRHVPRDWPTPRR